MAPLRLARLVVLVALCVAPSAAQVGTGFLPLTSHQSSSFDSVELNTLNVHFDIPILQKAGHGMPFNYALSYDSNIWSPVQTAWTPVAGWGWLRGKRTASGRRGQSRRDARSMSGTLSGGSGAAG